MHELSVCQALIGQVERIAHENGASRVEEIVVHIGPLSGVEAQLLEQAYTIARAGTMAEGAALRIVATPVRVRCRACGAESEAQPNRLLCGVCGEWRTDLVAGDEMVLASVALLTH
jgi:hydrogenase nickel incorporation protein HypA/HybF